MGDDIQEEWGGPHYDRGSGFTHHANDDCARGTKLPPRDTRQCSRFQAHEPHNWGSFSRCPGRIKDVTDIARAKHEPEVPIVEDPNVGPNQAIFGDFQAELKRATDLSDRVFAEDRFPPKADPTPAQELTSWYVKQAESEVEQLVSKMTEYGGMGRAVDLIEIGRNLALAQGRRVTDEEATELGIYFYELGKMARWTAAVVEHRRVSDDTLHDMGVYVRMAQRNRKVGGWPV